MTKYLLPINDSHDLYIDCVTAKEFKDAEERFIERLQDVYNCELPLDWDDALVELDEKGIWVGDIYDIEEF